MESKKFRAFQSHPFEVHAEIDLLHIFFTFHRTDITISTTAMAFKLPELPYAYDALEPYIDSTTMNIHHTKHHNT